MALFSRALWAPSPPRAVSYTHLVGGQQISLPQSTTRYPVERGPIRIKGDPAHPDGLYSLTLAGKGEASGGQFLSGSKGYTLSDNLMVHEYQDGAYYLSTLARVQGLSLIHISRAMKIRSFFMDATQVSTQEEIQLPQEPGKKGPLFPVPRKKKKWIKRGAILLVVLLAIWWFFLRPSGGGGGVSAAGQYIPVPASLQDLTVAVDGSGAVSYTHLPIRDR